MLLTHFDENLTLVTLVTENIPVLRENFQVTLLHKKTVTILVTD